MPFSPLLAASRVLGRRPHRAGSASPLLLRPPSPWLSPEPFFSKTLSLDSGPALIQDDLRLLLVPSAEDSIAICGHICSPGG